MARPRIGRLDQRLTLEERTLSRSASGEATAVWTEVDTVWARIERLRAREFTGAGSTDSDITHRVTIRYRSDVTRIHRLLDQGIIHDIRSMQSSRGRFWILMTESSGQRARAEFILTNAGATLMDNSGTPMWAN